MSEIKTRDKSKVGIRALDKSADIGQRMKNTLVKTKDRVDYIANTDAPSAEEYASDQVQNIASDAAHTTVDNTKSAVNRGKDAIRKHREKIKERANTDPVPDSPSSNGNHTGPQSTKPDAGNGAASSQTGTLSGRGGVTQSGNAAPRSTPGPATPRPRGNSITNPLPKPTTSQSPNPVKVPRQKPTRTVTHARNARTVGRASTRTIKGANQSTKVTIKTAKQAEKAAQKAAEASAKAAQKTAKATAKAAKSAGSAVAKTASATLKAIVAGMAKLIAAIAAGGWVAILIIVIVGVVAMIASSCFGLFAGWDDRPDLKAVMQSINEEYNSQIEEIKNSNIYDELELNGTRASWKEVLAVYSVVVTTDAENPQEVTTMTDEKEIMLTNIFWEMNSVTYSFRLGTVYETVEVEDGAGGVREEIEERQATILVIIVNHKSAWDIADQMHFTDEQREMLEQMLSSENDSMWSKLLYGVYGGSTDIVEVALSQIGNVGGEPYWRWYGFTERVSWCNCFVSWCADQCGYIEQGIIPMAAECGASSDWFKARGQWLDGAATPAPGMIIYFDWAPCNDYPNHVGIVERIENGLVYTVEGNSGDACAERWYTIGDFEIYGYGVPAYE